MKMKIIIIIIIIINEESGFNYLELAQGLRWSAWLQSPQTVH